MDMAGSLSDLWHHLLCRNVYESMEQYTKVELLEGENQYKAEGFGMQVKFALAFCTESISQGACSCSMAPWGTACNLLVSCTPKNGRAAPCTWPPTACCTACSLHCVHEAEGFSSVTRHGRPVKSYWAASFT